MQFIRAFSRLFCVPFTCALLLMIGVSSAAFASTAQRSVTNAGPCYLLASESTDASTQGQVSILQKKLKDKGENLGTFGPNHDGIDGIFGDMTRAAVMSFQGKNGLLPPDGMVGPQTWGKLGGCAAPAQPVQPVVDPNTFHRDVSNDGAKGSATFTFTGTTQITKITMSVQDIKCDSHDVYIQLKVHSRSNGGGVHNELRERNSSGCHVSNAAIWNGLSYTNTVANSAGDLSIEGVEVEVCVDDFGNDTCKSSDYVDNPLVK